MYQCNASSVCVTRKKQVRRGRSLIECLRDVNVRRTARNCTSAGADGLGNGDEANIPGAVFTQFATRNITRVSDGTKLTYWAKWSRQKKVTTATILISGDGVCGAWARFFLDCLRAQGLVYKDTNEPPIIDVIPKVKREFILVKVWNFPAKAIAGHASGIYPYRNVLPVRSDVLPYRAKSFEQNKYAWYKGLDDSKPKGQPLDPDVTDVGRTGLPGQNNPTPMSIFGDHAG